MRTPIIRLFRVYWDAGMRLTQDYGLPLASAATYSGLLTLFPFLIFVTSLAGFLGGAELADQAVLALFQRLPHEVADTLAPEIRRVLGGQRGDFLTFGILLTFLFSSSGVETLRTALNRAYRMREDRPFWWRFLQNMLFVVLAAIAMLVFGLATIATPWLQGAVLRVVPAMQEHVRVFTELRVAIGIVVLGALLLAMHFWLPAGRRRLKDVWPGVAHTIALWLLGGMLYAVYLEHSTYYAKTYAGLANIMIALVFFNSMAVIFVFGAELNRAFIEERRRRLRGVSSARGRPGEKNGGSDRSPSAVQ